MKLSVSTWAFNDKTREEALGRIGAMGVEGVEIIAHAPPFHVHTDFTDELVGYVKGLLAANKLEISAISPSTEFLQFTEEGMEAQLAHMRKVVDLCARLGADHARIFAGGRVPEDRSREECLRVVIHGLQESVKIAEAKGEAERFLSRVLDYEIHEADCRELDRPASPSKASAALLRSSLDLSRALAAMRRRKDR